MHKLILIALLAATAAYTQQGDLPRTPGAAGKAAPSKAKVLTRVELDQLLATSG